MICHIFYPLSTSWLSNMNLKCVVIIYHNPQMQYHINPKDRHKNWEKALSYKLKHKESPLYVHCFMLLQTSETCWARNSSCDLLPWHQPPLIVFLTCYYLGAHPFKDQKIFSRVSLKPNLYQSWLVAHPIEKALIFGDGGGVYMWFNTGYSSNFQKSYKKR